METPTAILLIGIPASGKSTFFRKRFSRSHVHISLDLLKTRYQERLLLEACLMARLSFVVDNTNVTRAARARFIEPARQAGYRVIGFYFAAPLSVA